LLELLKSFHGEGGGVNRSSSKSAAMMDLTEALVLEAKENMWGKWELRV
jgi:hypothetical protein